MERLAVLHPFTSNLQDVLQDCFEDVGSLILRFRFQLRDFRAPDAFVLGEAARCSNSIWGCAL